LLYKSVTVCYYRNTFVRASLPIIEYERFLVARA